MLKRANMVEHSSGTDTLTLEVDSNESAVIKDVMLYNIDGDDEDIKLTVDRKLMCHFKVPEAWHLIGSNSGEEFRRLMDVFQPMGLGLQIPVGAGQKVEVTAPGANNYMELVYDLYTADDQTPKSPYGTESDRDIFYQVISNSSSVTAAGDVALDASDTDAAFPQFPGGAEVPGGTEMRLHALFGAGFAQGDGSNTDFVSSYFKMKKDREDILDKDMNGILLLGDATYTTEDYKYETVAGRLALPDGGNKPKIIVFDNPIVFRSGQELNAYMTVTEETDGGTIATGSLKMGMVFELIRV